jgi:hypothetical protein
VFRKEYKTVVSIIFMKKQYTLEVQKYTGEGKAEVAIEIMDKIFLSKQDACEYYDIHNKHMRSLNAHGTWTSDWDPYSRLRYVVRKYDGECRSIPPF